MYYYHLLYYLLQLTTIQSIDSSVAVILLFLCVHSPHLYHYYYQCLSVSVLLTVSQTSPVVYQSYSTFSFLHHSFSRLSLSRSLSLFHSVSLSISQVSVVSFCIDVVYSFNSTNTIVQFSPHFCQSLLINDARNSLFLLLTSIPLLISFLLMRYSK